MKNPVTPAGIETATFRFVTQHLNHCATAVPVLYFMSLQYPSVTEPDSSGNTATEQQNL